MKFYLIQFQTCIEHLFFERQCANGGIELKRTASELRPQGGMVYVSFLPRSAVQRHTQTNDCAPQRGSKKDRYIVLCEY